MVILDMEMPKGCNNCKFLKKEINFPDYNYVCEVGGTEFPESVHMDDTRAEDCPIKGEIVDRYLLKIL